MDVDGEGLGSGTRAAISSQGLGESKVIYKFFNIQGVNTPVLFKVQM